MSLSKPTLLLPLHQMSKSCWLPHGVHCPLYNRRVGLPHTCHMNSIFGGGGSQQAHKNRPTQTPRRRGDSSQSRTIKDKKFHSGSTYNGTPFTFRVHLCPFLLQASRRFSRTGTTHRCFTQSPSVRRWNGRKLNNKTSNDIP